MAKIVKIDECDCWNECDKCAVKRIILEESKHKEYYQAIDLAKESIEESYNIVEKWELAGITIGNPTVYTNQNSIKPGDVIKIINKLGAGWLEEGKTYTIREVNTTIDSLVFHIKFTDLTEPYENAIWNCEKKDFEKVEIQWTEVTSFPLIKNIKSLSLASGIVRLTDIHDKFEASDLNVYIKILTDDIFDERLMLGFIDALEYMGNSKIDNRPLFKIKQGKWDEHREELGKLGKINIALITELED